MGDTRKGTWILDIEVYPDLFLVGILDYKENKTMTFEISQRKDEREKLFKTLNSFGGFLVTFNGLHYDEVVLSYFLKNYKKELKHETVDDFCYLIKDFSDEVIKDNFEYIKSYKWFKRGWKSIDLFNYWSKGLRLSKQISLKGLGIQLNHEEVQELPFPIDHKFGTNDEEINLLIHYNTKNDLGITKKVFEALKGQVELRGYIKKEYGLESWSLDAPKIASEYLLEVFCQKTFPWDIWKDKPDCDARYQEYKRDVRNKRYEPEPFKVGDYLPPVNFKTPQFQALWERMKASGGGFKEHFVVDKNDTLVELLPSDGGIHSVNNNQYFQSDEEWVIVDADIALR